MYQKGELIIHEKYRVEALLGEGSFGAVYRVRDLILDEVVAMKRLHNPENRAAYEREIKVLGNLRKGPHILTFHHYEFDESGAMVLVMEYMAGGSLEQVLTKKGPLPEADALVLLRHMAEALVFSHCLQKPILHRDIKPANILKQGNDWYLGDWGIGGAKEGSNTKGAGTFLYNAPEVFDGKRYPESDIYSLGMTLFHALTGEPGFTGTDAMVMMGHLQKSVDFSRRGISSTLKPLLQGMLEKDPKKRLGASVILQKTGTLGTGTLDGLPNIVVSPKKQTVQPVFDSGGTLLDLPKVEIVSNSIRDPTPGSIWKCPVTDMEFIFVPSGKFQMGSPQSEEDHKDDEPVHDVELDGFWIGKYPVTQGQWHKVMGDNPSAFKKGDNYPVEQVSWDDTQEFLKKLNARNSGSFRLPSEAQWEYACRAGTTTPFSFGNTINADTEANYDGNYPYGGGSKGKYREGTTPVGAFPANAWGLYDMHGNVWEWVQDIYAEDAYGKHGHRNPIYEESGSFRVFRGGSWDDDAGGLRSAYRFWFLPGPRLTDIGFRVVSAPPGP